jgi:hypothetical protein
VKSVTDIITKVSRRLEEKSSSYPTIYNPPVSQSMRLELVVSKNLRGRTLTEKHVRIAKEERQGDVGKVGGGGKQRNQCDGDWGVDICAGREIFFLID